jgi:hypothetical protein
MVRQTLLALYPRWWRDQYGEEYSALLEDTGISPSIAFDVAASALKLWLHEHSRVLAALSVLGQYSFSIWLCVHLHITDNMFWLPTSLLQTIGLLITYAPLLYVLWMQTRATKLLS